MMDMQIKWFKKD